MTFRVSSMGGKMSWIRRHFAKIERVGLIFSIRQPILA